MRQDPSGTSTQDRAPVAAGVASVRCSESESLRELALSLSSSVGTKFFRRLVDELCRMLSCDFALIGELLPGLPERVRTIAASRKGVEIPDFEYGLDFSPCANVMGQTLRSYPRGVQGLFPKDAFLSEFGIEGYLGIPLFDSSSSAIGLVVVLYEQPVQDVPRAESVLQIFASRASAELEWLRKDRALRESEKRYRSLFERNVAGVGMSTLEGQILEANDAFVKLLGYASAEELKAADARAMYPCPEAREPFLERLKKERVLLGYECEVRRRDGSTGWTVENVALLRDEEHGRDVIQATIIDVTALKRAEHALRESEGQLRHAAKSAQIGYWRWEVEADRVTWSDEEFAHFGITSDEWKPTYAGFLERVHPDDLAFVRGVVESAFQCRGPRTYELRIVRPTGEIRHLQSTIESVRDDTGRVVEMFGTSIDLTDRVRAEEERQASERKYRELFETSRDGIVFMDLTGRIVHHNSAFAEMLGYSEGDLRGLGCGEITPPKWHEMQAAIIEKHVLTRGESDEYEKEYVRRDGSIFPASLRTWLRRDEAGQPMGFWTIARDITERKLASDAMRESEGRFRALADAVPVMVWRSGKDKTCIDANEGWLEFTGRTLQEEIRGGLSLGMYPDDRDRCLATYSRAFDLREPFEMEYRLRRSDGEYRRIVDRGVPHYSPDGEFLGYVGGALDVTDRKRAEEEARHRDVELAQLSRVSTLGEMAAGLAHELNQPLSAIANYINGCTRRLRESGTTNAAILNVMERASSEALRAGEILRRLREFIRRDDPVRRSACVNRIVEDTVRLLDAETRYRGAVLSTDVEASLPSVSVDEIQIEQVLVNLIRNAMDAMEASPPESRRITVGTCRVNDGNVGVSVRDAGPGVSPELADRIFESFVTTKPDGLGMGLSICRRIVQAHCGELWVESGDGGAVFRFTLPIARSEESPGD